jgi:hypothetical protein
MLNSASGGDDGLGSSSIEGTHMNQDRADVLGFDIHHTITTVDEMALP